MRDSKNGSAFIQNLSSDPSLHGMEAKALESSKICFLTELELEQLFYVCPLFSLIEKVLFKTKLEGALMILFQNIDRYVIDIDTYRYRYVSYLFEIFSYNKMLLFGLVFVLF